MRYFLSLFLLATFLTSCAHHRDVRPGADGVHRVQVQAETKQEGQRDSLSQASHYCETLKLRPAIVKEDHSYTGQLDESIYQNTQKAKEAANILLGGTSYQHEANQAASSLLGKAYTINMSFKCQ